MSTTDEHYHEAIRNMAAKLLHFLRAFEAAQEEIHLAHVAESQTRLREAVGESFPALPAKLAALSAPASLQAFHAHLSEAVVCFADAYALFVSNSSGPQFGQRFVNSRQALCRGLYRLYPLRAQFPPLQPYWVLPAGSSAPVEPEPTPQEDTVPVGFIHKDSGNWRAEYSLYVPEYYTSRQRWPLIVCLHGGFGHGDEYIWTWLRPAKSKGYLLLSPKSLGPTWSVLTPALDIRSIQAMLDDVLATYAVDRARIYLTGLSDGGIFTYLLGLARPELFAGIAPVAGQMHSLVDTLLRHGRGKALPIFVVHGAQDYIFPVAFTRQTCNLLTRLGYNVTYEELPDWGHAYTYTINEQLVLPWFESLGVRSAGATR